VRNITWLESVLMEIVNRSGSLNCIIINVRGPFEKFVDWRKCAAVMQREAATYTKL
jgi:hypothetical protein